MKHCRFPSLLVLGMTCVSCAHLPKYGSDPIFPPGPLHSHSSSIVETPGGHLLACWYQGSGERRANDVLVQGAWRQKGDAAWTTPFVMADSPDLPDCNPVLFIDGQSTLWLFRAEVHNNQWGDSILKYCATATYSPKKPVRWEVEDEIRGGPADFEEKFLETVDKAEAQYAALLQLNPQYREELAELRQTVRDKSAVERGWMPRVHPILTSANRLMLGLYSDVFNCSVAVFTADGGKSWQFSEPILTWELGNIQPSFVQKRDGAVVALMRDNGLPKRIRIAESNDRGMTWSEVRHMKIPNPGSSVECIALKNGHWVLICNDTNSGRHRLTAYLSDDEGASWKWKRPLENFEPGAGSASYPSVIQTSDGLIHCTYSFSTKAAPGETIKHAWFNEAWLRAADG